MSSPSSTTTTAASTSSTVPPPLPAHAVSLLLSYLSPFDGGLPPHLLSEPLRQRHHFLGIGDVLDGSEDAVAYLSWPSPGSSDPNADSQRVVQLLSALPPPEHADPLAAYPTKYTHDGECVYAHASVPVQDFSSSSTSATREPAKHADGLRLVFRWEADGSEGVVAGHGGNADGWKYHDLKPLPFPPDARDSPQAALDPKSSSTAASLSPGDAPIPAVAASSNSNSHASALDGEPSIMPRPAFEPNMYHEDVESDSDGDSYWNSYGRSSSDDEEDDTFDAQAASAGGATDDEKAEDAYWAQYASVHGSADSTRPSPLPHKRKLHDTNQPLPSASYDPFDIEHIEHLQHMQEVEDQRDVRALATMHFSPGALSPEALSRRLHTLSPRPPVDPLESPAIPTDAGDQESLSAIPLDVDVDGDDLSDSPPTSDGLTLTPPALPTSGSGSDSPITEVLSPRPRRSHERISINGFAENLSADEGLRDSVKGLYRLWMSSRKDEQIAETKEAFLNVVRDALTQI